MWKFAIEKNVDSKIFSKADYKTTVWDAALPNQIANANCSDSPHNNTFKQMNMAIAAQFPCMHSKLHILTLFDHVFIFYFCILLSIKFQSSTTDWKWLHFRKEKRSNILKIQCNEIKSSIKQ